MGWRGALTFAREAGGLRGSDGPPDARRLAGQSPGLLALHGFGSTPREMDPVVDLAEQLGLAALAPLLPGHGLHARALAATRFSNWYASAEAALLELAGQGPVVIAGQSMGSVVAMHLAAQHPTAVCGLIVLANATRLYAPFPATFLDALGLIPGLDVSLPKFGGPDIADPEGKRQHLVYSASPARAALSLQRAGRRALRLLPQIHCPTLILHGALDGVCPPANAWAVANRLGTAHVEVVFLTHSRHILTKDLQVAELQRCVGGFLRQRILQSRARTAPGQSLCPVEP